MSSPFLLGIAAVGIIFSGIAVYYITVLKNGFEGLGRLERPWVILGCGVGSLVVAALTVPWAGASTIVGVVELVAVVVAAFFILTAMVMMKQAWTIGEGD